MKVFIFISGGAFKAVALFSALNRLITRYKVTPTVLGGVSSGAIASFVYATKNIDKGLDLSRNVRVKNIFKRRPSSIISIFKILLGIILIKTKIISKEKIKRKYNYMSPMTGLKKLLKETVSPEEFYSFQNTSSSPDVFILAVNADTKQKKLWNLKNINISYEKAIDIVIASCSIAAICPAIEIDGEYYYDGGHRDHSPGRAILDLYTFTKKEQIEIITIFSRPEEEIEINDKWQETIFDVFLHFILETFNIEVSLNDYERENDFAKYRPNVTYKPIFIEKFLNSMYDDDPHRLEKGNMLGKIAVDKYYGKTSK